MYNLWRIVKYTVDSILGTVILKNFTSYNCTNWLAELVFLGNSSYRIRK